MIKSIRLEDKNHLYPEESYGDVIFISVHTDRVFRTKTFIKLRKLLLLLLCMEAKEENTNFSVLYEILK